VPKVLFTFGREDELDREAVRRLVASLSRLLEPGEALAATTAPDLEFTSSVPFGGTYVLDHLWRRRLHQCRLAADVSGIVVALVVLFANPGTWLLTQCATNLPAVV